MIPVFYIGINSGEIHLKMDKVHKVNIKIAKSFILNSYGRAITSFNGCVEKVIINDIDCTERFKDRRITYGLLCELYKDSTGKNMKYGTIVSARNNIPAVESIIRTITPDLYIDFKTPDEKPKVAPPIAIDDQIFKSWMNYV